MNEDPTRLIDEDPAFARLVDASNRHEPASRLTERALLLATQGSAKSYRRPWQVLGTGLVAGIAILASVAGFVATQSGSAPLDVGAQATDVAAPNPAATEHRSEAAPKTVSVDDLALSAAPLASAHEPGSNTGRVGARSASLRAQAPNPRAKADTPVDSSASHPAPSQGTFSEELAVIRAARSFLEAGDVPSCLRTVDRYDQRFRSGLFKQEVDVIRIEALAKSGERARAEMLAQRFLAANPKSPYAHRVRSLVEPSRNQGSDSSSGPTPAGEGVEVVSPSQ